MVASALVLLVLAADLPAPGFTRAGPLDLRRVGEPELAFEDACKFARPDSCEPGVKLDEAIERIVGAPAPASQAPRGQRWDGRSPPARLDVVERRFGLTPDERARLEANGFVVPARLEWSDWGNAFYQVHRSQLPLYVSVDAVLHAVYVGNDQTLIAFENAFSSKLQEALKSMQEALPKAGADYPPETVDDLNLYLSVTRRLLGDDPVEALPRPLEARVLALVKQARAAEGMASVSLFGRVRLVDFSTFKPRGHYTGSLAPYFRAASWLSRVELNLSSRGCASSHPGATCSADETPREALLALALADLAQKAEVFETLTQGNRAWRLLAGASEDVSLGQLADLRQKASLTSLRDPDAADKLRAAIGEGFVPTARTHPLPGTDRLPVVAAVLGLAVGTDVKVAHQLVHGKVPSRYELGVAELAFAFGHDRAREYLAADLKQYPALSEQLATARQLAAGTRGDGLYGDWLAAIGALSQRPDGLLPTFMERPAYQDLRLGSFVAAYGQLRHNYVLMAAQEYEEGGCEIPDGYVEPAPAVYDALIAYAKRGAEAMKAMDLDLERSYFERLGKLLTVLRAIAAEELANHPLSPEARQFLAGVVELSATTGMGYTRTCAATYGGWYFDLFPGGTTPFDDASFIADFFRSSNTGRVSYAGARGPRLGIFVIDTGGEPRVAVGPVAHGYEYRAGGKRLDDAASRKLDPRRLVEPWAASYTSAAPPEPALTVTCAAKGPGHRTCTVRGRAEIGAVTLTRIGYHGEAVEPVTRTVGRAEAKFEFEQEIPFEPPLLRVSAGTFVTDVALEQLWKEKATAVLAERR